MEIYYIGEERVMDIVNELGKIKIADEVIARIAGISASQCDGIVGMASKRATDGIVELLGMENITKGIRVNNKEDQLTIDLYVVIKFGMSIEQTAQAVMDKVRNDIKELTGLEPTTVNVIVEGIEF
jgi:uncharacterized alkaline shock family protein YloU